jgi:D-glycero-D-manno-heptose 1,7-bisphosphate phosphatase
MQGILLLSIDGCLRQKKSGSGFITSPYDQMVVPGAQEAMKNFDGWLKIGVSNQGGVGAGHKSLKNCILEQMITMQAFPDLQAIYFCPDFAGDRCYLVDRSEIHSVLPMANKILDAEFQVENKYAGHYRKPRTGMIDHALDDYAQDCSSVLIVGDRREDNEVALRASIPYMPAHEWLKFRFSSINS